MRLLARGRRWPDEGLRKLAGAWGLPHAASRRTCLYFAAWCLTISLRNESAGIVPLIRHGVIRAIDFEPPQDADEIRLRVLHGQSHRGERATHRVFDELKRIGVVRETERAELDRVAGVRRPESDGRDVVHSRGERLMRCVSALRKVCSAGQTRGACDVDESPCRRIRVETVHVRAEETGGREAASAVRASGQRFDHGCLAAHDGLMRVGERDDAFGVGVGEREVRAVRAGLARCAARQESLRQALDVEAAVSDHDDIGVVTEARARRCGNDDEVDVLLRIQARFGEEPVRFTVAADVVRVARTASRRWRWCESG